MLRGKHRGVQRVSERILLVVLAVLVPGTLLTIASVLVREGDAERALRTASAITEARRSGYVAEVECWLQSAHLAAEAACGAEARQLPIAGPLGASLHRTSDTDGSIVAPIRLEARVILGSNEGSHIDPLLRADPFFRRAPLDRFASLRVASQVTTEIEPEQPWEVALPGSAPVVVTVDRTLDSEGRMRVRMRHGEQPAFGAAARGEWLLLVAPGELTSAGRDSIVLAMRFGGASRDSWRSTNDALLRAVSCGELRVPLALRLEMADGATLFISDGGDPELEETIELQGHRFALTVSQPLQDAPVAEGDYRVEMLVLSAVGLLGVFAYLGGVRFARRGRDGHS